MKGIEHCLKAQRDKGLLHKPCQSLNNDAYPHADFAGHYSYMKIIESECVKSRMGFLIPVSECPVFWVSKLQSEMAMSIMEEEIIALAHYCHDLIPIAMLV